ncbi:MAG: phosphoglucosamine mutase [Betaproteobacteria bacterium]
MNRKYFGTDGIRGEVGTYPITPDFMMRLGYAAGRVLSKKTDAIHGRPGVLIGKDTRISGYMLEAALEAGFSAAGIDVFLCGPIPTPGVAYLTRALRLSAGAVISASHNLFQDNGVKFFSAVGDKLSDAMEREIEAELEEPFQCVPSAQLGKVKRLDDAAGRYIEFCKSTFPNDLDLHGLKLVVDSAHGAAYHIASHVFHELGAEVISIGNQPNGQNINDHVGATSPQLCVETVLREKAHFGIALDGDADRLQMVDHEGRLFNGDELLYLIALHQKDQNQPLDGVVGTLMTNLAVEHALQKIQVPFERAAVGDRYVLEMLKAKGWKIGGESSGHLLFLDKHTTGDGIVAALQILMGYCRNKVDLSQSLADVKLFPQVMLNIRYKREYDWKSDESLKARQELIEKELGSTGRVLIRASGTEPVLRVMVEALDRLQAEKAAKYIANGIPLA